MSTINCVSSALTNVSSITTPTVNHASGVYVQYNGSTKLQTTNTGCNITGICNCSGEVQTSSVDSNSGDLVLSRENTEQVRLESGGVSITGFLSSSSNFVSYGNITGAGTLNVGAGTVSSLTAGSGAISTTGILSCGSLKTTSYNVRYTKASGGTSNIVFTIRTDKAGGAWYPGVVCTTWAGVDADSVDMMSLKKTDMFRMYSSDSINIQNVESHSYTSSTAPTATLACSTANGSYDEFTITCSGASTYKIATVDFNYYLAIQTAT